MAAFSTHFCSLCQEDDISTQADSWCLECGDWLCTDCERHHERSKISKQHKTIKAVLYDALPSSVVKISNKCPLHNVVFDRFCSLHETPCCITCVSETHKKCELSPLDEVLQNIKQSTAVSHLERDLNEVSKNFEMIEKNLLNRIAKVQNEQKHCLNEIKRVRASVNAHLDTIEKRITDEVLLKEKSIQKNIDILAGNIETRKNRVENLHHTLLQKKQHTTDLHIFLSIKEMEKQITEEIIYLKTLEEGDAMAEKCLKLQISGKLETLKSTVDTFGRITVNTSPSTLRLIRTSQEQAQISTPIVATFETINPVNTFTINHIGAQPPLITACTILPHGEIILADFRNGVLMLYDRKGQCARNVATTQSIAFDMCYVKEDTIGVSFPIEKKVDFFNVLKNKAEKTIKFKNSCYGIDCHGNRLFIRFPEEDSVDIMNIDGKVKHRVKIPGHDINVIAFHQDCIYCAKWTTSDVFCYDMDGNMIWKQKYEELVRPESITIDKNLGIIYAAGVISNNIIAISVDGTKRKIVISEQGVRTVHFSRSNNLLVASCCDGLTNVYQL